MKKDCQTKPAPDDLVVPDSWDQLSMLTQLGAFPNV